MGCCAQQGGAGGVRCRRCARLCMRARAAPRNAARAGAHTGSARQRPHLALGVGALGAAEAAAHGQRDEQARGADAREDEEKAVGARARAPEGLRARGRLGGGRQGLRGLAAPTCLPAPGARRQALASQPLGCAWRRVRGGGGRRAALRSPHRPAVARLLQRLLLGRALEQHDQPTHGGGGGVGAVSARVRRLPARAETGPLRCPRRAAPGGTVRCAARRRPPCPSQRSHATRHSRRDGLLQTSRQERCGAGGAGCGAVMTGDSGANGAPRRPAGPPKAPGRACRATRPSLRGGRAVLAGRRRSGPRAPPAPRRACSSNDEQRPEQPAHLRGEAAAAHVARHVLAGAGALLGRERRPGVWSGVMCVDGLRTLPPGWRRRRGRGGSACWLVTRRGTGNHQTQAGLAWGR